MSSFVYILECSDGSYYTGSTGNLEYRLAEHQEGKIPGYTKAFALGVDAGIQLSQGGT